MLLLSFSLLFQAVFDKDEAMPPLLEEAIPSGIGLLPVLVDFRLMGNLSVLCGANMTS